MTQDKKIYQIHICDDIKEHALSLQTALQALNDEFPSIITISHSADELLSKFQPVEEGRENAPDIIFMDIRLPENDGITLGKKIKDLCPDTYLVLVTAYAEYAIKGYEAATFRYLLKPVRTDELWKLFAEIKADSNKFKKILIKGKKNSALVCIQDILYISAEDKYAIVYTKKGHFISDMSLNKYEDKLGSYGFYRIHRKCLVNIFHHQGIINNKVQLSDGTLLPISKAKKAAYQSCIFTYMHKDIV